MDKKDRYISIIIWYPLLFECLLSGNGHFPSFLEILCATVHNTQAGITRLLIGQPDCKFLIHSRKNTGKGIYKKGNAFSLNTTVIFSVKCKLTDYMFHLLYRWVYYQKGNVFKQVLLILSWDQWYYRIFYELY
jgi:hypothetical protein